MKLTASKIRYLIAITSLSDEQNEVQFTNLCSELKLAKGSVHRMLDFMKKMNLIYKTPDSKICLTETGKQLGIAYQEKYKALKTHFTSQYRLTKTEVEEVCFALLEVLSDHSIEKMLCA